jgi:radial spoke head protein 9
MGLVYSDQYEFAQKKFYWAISGEYNFIELPDLNEAHADFINRDRTFFTGEPNRKLIQPAEGEEDGEEAAAQDEDEEGEEGEKEQDSDVSEAEEVKIPVRDLVEIDRLSFVVHAIENDCQIAPVGAFKMTAEHQLRRNEAFQGLNDNQALSLNSYVHFRNVQNSQTK